MCGVGFISCNAFSWIEKDDDLAKINMGEKIDYAKPLKLTWDVRNCDSKSTKGERKKEMQAVCQYHE
jgi:hypothetical protein